MPVVTTPKAAKRAARRIRRASEEIRSEWTGRERRARRLEAFRMQNRLASVLVSGCSA